MGRSSKTEKKRKDEDKTTKRGRDRKDAESRSRHREERKRSYREENDDQSRSHRHDDGDYDDRKKRNRDDVGDRKRRHSDDRKRSHRDDDQGGRKRRRRDDHTKDRKRQDRDDDEKRDRKRRKADGEEKSKSMRKNTHSADKKGEKRATKNRAVDKSRLFDLGGVFGRAPDRLLEAERDYFEFHQHLWVYLFREEGAVFNDLSSEESHGAFARFVQKYNAGDLESAYYDPNGLPPDALLESKTTLHKWSFSTSDREEKNLEMLREGIRKQTEFTGSRHSAADAKVATLAPQLVPQGEKIVGNNHGDRQHDRRVDSKRLKEIYQDAELELLGGPKEGRDRELEKRKEVADRIHGASKQRDDAFELPDDVLYGGGEDRDFQRAIAREKDERAKREIAKQSRLEELKSKEAEKQQNMLKMLGLSNTKPGQKIEIAPRRDD